MNLCLDMGNSNIKYGLFRGKRLLKKGMVAKGNFPQIRRILEGKGFKTVKNVIICSTVPKNNPKIRQVIRQIFHLEPWIIKENLPISIPSKYKSLKKLGADRLLNLYRALQTFRRPFLLVSFGTAITLDYVSRRGIHEGGLILPGLPLSAWALYRETESLPLVKPLGLGDLLGRDTKGCIRSGLIYGTAEAISGLIERIRKSKKEIPRCFVIGVGGDAQFLKKAGVPIDKVLPDFTLESLNYLFLRKK